jgi:hypothetical protein
MLFPFIFLRLCLIPSTGCSASCRLVSSSSLDLLFVSTTFCFANMTREYITSLPPIHLSLFAKGAVGKHLMIRSKPYVFKDHSRWVVMCEQRISWFLIQSLRSPDLSPLTDPTYITRCLSSLPTSVSQNPNRPGGTGWRGLGTTTEVLFLTEHQTPQ